ncbi:glycosyltransferase family 4 protein [Vibrio cholerae]|uniref:glycosyltransferase family 4 protein n=1 Tax=Vibrio cholerae TaxID=666 RepID=UPI0022AEC160|nr:glycosyltransferase family 4 protein [Vibrio cholerae]
MSVPRVLLISNMYPSDSEPGFGTFVKNIFNQIGSNGLHIDKIVIDKKNISSITKIKLYLIMYMRTLLNFKKYTFCYIHFISHTSIPFIILNFLGFKFKLVSHVHGGDVKLLSGFSSFQFRVKRHLVKRTLMISEKIIVPSRSYADYLMENYEVSGENIVVYPSGGVNMSIFNYIGKSNVVKGLVGYAGRLIKSKNVDLIIKSLLQLPDYRLEIVGDGQELAALTNLVKELNLEGVVRFLPAKSQQELAEWYQTIDCLVYPSESESLGLVPIEAMSCGVFCVLSDIPAFRELLDAQLNIELMRSLSPSSISDSVKQLETWSEELRFKNSIRVQELYSSEKVKKELLSVFQ